MRLLLSGGGSAGHVLPALAVLDKLSLQSGDVLYVGSHAGPDATLVKGKYPYKGIFTGKFRRYGSGSLLNPLLILQNLGDAILFLAGLIQSLWIVGRFSPDVVFCNGGFTSVPVALAAKVWQRPVVIQEADQAFGIANRILEKIATRIALAYPLRNQDSRSEVTGNPIREELFKSKPATKVGGRELDASVPTVLVTGGTLGASRINRAVFAGLIQLLNRCQVIHSVGEQDWNEALVYKERLEKSLKSRYFPTKFLADEYVPLLQRSQVVVTRGGAGSLWEAAALSKPMIIIPITHSANNHQMINARHFSDQKAAVLLKESDLDGGRLTSQIESLLAEASAAAKMGEAARRLINLDGADRLAALITRTAKAPRYRIIGR